MSEGTKSERRGNLRRRKGQAPADGADAVMDKGAEILLEVLPVGEHHEDVVDEVAGGVRKQHGLCATMSTRESSVRTFRARDTREGRTAGMCAPWAAR